MNHILKSMIRMNTVSSRMIKNIFTTLELSILLPIMSKEFCISYDDFSYKKKFERYFKHVFQGPLVSCIPPEPYAERFLKFIDELFETKTFVEKSISNRPITFNDE